MHEKSVVQLMTGGEKAMIVSRWSDGREILQIISGINQALDLIELNPEIHSVEMKINGYTNPGKNGSMTGYKPRPDDVIADRPYSEIDGYERLLTRIRGFPITVTAVVRGELPKAGWELALACNQCVNSG